MKTKRLQQMAVATFALLLAGTTAYAGDTRKNVYMNVEKIDHTVGVPPVLKTPQIPAVWIEGRELNCQGEHPAYVLSIIDSAGNLVYTTEIPESATQVTLPTEPLEGFTVEFVDGTWRLFGRLAPDGYRPMVVDGKTWKGYEVDQLTGQRYRLDYFLDGDTLIGGKKYLRCFRDSERYQDKAPRYIGALIEEDGMVYSVPSFLSSPGLMYDFNLQVDDSVFWQIRDDPNNFTFIDKRFRTPRMDERGEEYFLSFKLKDIETIHDNNNAQMRRFVFDIQRHNVVQHVRRRTEYANEPNGIQGTASGGAYQTINVVGTLYWSEGVGVENYYPFKPWEDPFDTQYKYQLEECYIQKKQVWSRAMVQEKNPYRPLVVEGKTWKGYETNGITGQRYRMDYFLQGDIKMPGKATKNDTILFRGSGDGKQYKKLYCYSERLAKKGIVQPMYLGGLREEDGKVYGTWESYGVKLDPQEVPIFDFGMEVGDSAYCALSSVPAGIQGYAFMASNRVCGVEDYYQNLHDYCIKLDSIVNITDDKGLSVRSYNFCAYGRILPQGGDNEFFRIPNALTWVEGLGAIGGYPFLGWETWWNWDLLWKDRFESSYTYELEECFVDEKILSSGGSTTGISPAEQMPAKAESSVLYDLQGRRIQGESQKGMYIRGGKKYVRK